MAKSSAGKSDASKRAKKYWKSLSAAERKRRIEQATKNLKKARAAKKKSSGKKASKSSAGKKTQAKKSAKKASGGKSFYCKKCKKKVRGIAIKHYNMHHKGKKASGGAKKKSGGKKSSKKSSGKKASGGAKKKSGGKKMHGPLTICKSNLRADTEAGVPFGERMANYRDCEKLEKKKAQQRANEAFYNF